MQKIGYIFLPVVQKSTGRLGEFAVDSIHVELTKNFISNKRVLGRTALKNRWVCLVHVDALGSGADFQNHYANKLSSVR